MSTIQFYQSYLNIYIGMNPCKKTYKKTAHGGLLFWWTRQWTVYSHMRFRFMGPFHYVRFKLRFTCFHQLTFRTLLRVLVRLSLQNKKPHMAVYYFGGRAGTRTLDPLIKSQLLYQLSYASRTEFLIRTGVIIDFFLVNASLYHNYVATNAISYALYHQLSAHLPMS